MTKKKAKEKNKGGRPTDYKEEYAEQARKLCLLGYIDKELADFFEVVEATINTWKKKHPEFLESLKKGKEIADANVAASLYERACGYSHPEDKIFAPTGDSENREPLIVPTTKHYPPDTGAAFIWLKNRRAGSLGKEGFKWKDRQEIEHSGGITLEADYGSPAE